MENQAKKIINKIIGVEHGFLVGRACTALGLSLQSISTLTSRRKIVLPSMGCSALVQIVIYEGFIPVFVDINLENLSFDLNSLELNLDGEIAAILVVHQFGIAADVMQIKKIAAKSIEKKVFIIEDVCQSLGGTYQGKPLGSFGDYTICSFSGDKIINVRSGGGYLGVKDKSNLGLIELLIKKLDEKLNLNSYNMLSLSHRNLYHAVVDLQKFYADRNVDSPLLSMIDSYKMLYYYKYDFSGIPELVNELKKINEILLHRAEIANIYFDGLSQINHIKIPKHWNNSDCLWRFPFYLNDAKYQSNLTLTLRAEGHDVSNHYWPLSKLFGYKGILPNTEEYSRKIINLWVNKNYNRERSVALVNSIRDFYAQQDDNQINLTK